MFEGMTIAGYAIGAAEGILYLRGEYAYLRAFLEDVLAKRRAAGLLGRDILGKSGFNFDIRIQMGAGAYVCGEETALLSSCEGRRGDPKTRPPFPAQKGYLDMPTVVNNVETLCCAARILEKGPGWFASIGTKGSSGTKLFSISGDCTRPGVYEVPFGITRRRAADAARAPRTPSRCRSAAPRGQHDRPGGVRPADLLRRPGHRRLGHGLRPGTRRAGDRRTPFMDFFVEESCGYCTPCRVGNVPPARSGWTASSPGRAKPADLDYLEKTRQDDQDREPLRPRADVAEPGPDHAAELPRPSTSAGSSRAAPRSGRRSTRRRRWPWPPASRAAHRSISEPRRVE